MEDIIYEDRDGDIIMKGVKCKIMVFWDFQKNRCDGYTLDRDGGLPESIVGDWVSGRYELVNTYIIPSESVRDFFSFLIRLEDQPREFIQSYLERFVKKY